MKKLLISLFVFTFVFGMTTVYALDFGDDITISDLVSTGTGWYSDREDQETEPGTVTNQSWDLEGFFLDDAKLTMVGGYDFRNNPSWKSGDIFFDVTGDVVYGPANDGSGSGHSTIDNDFGYDYVLDMDFDNLTYNIYEIDETAQVKSVWYSINQESNAWRYESGGNLIGGGSIDYLTGLSDADTGFRGGLHNAVTVDLGFLHSATTFTSHFTMGCGNDNLMGHGETPVPEPGTLLLLGGGIISLIAFARKRGL